MTEKEQEHWFELGKKVERNERTYFTSKEFWYYTWDDDYVLSDYVRHLLMIHNVKNKSRTMKEKIEQMYIQALIDDLAPNVFADQVLRLLGVGTRTFRFSGMANGVKFVINVQAPNRESAIAYFEDEHPKLKWRTTTEIMDIS